MLMVFEQKVFIDCQTGLVGYMEMFKIEDFNFYIIYITEKWLASF